MQYLPWLYEDRCATLRRAAQDRTIRLWALPDLVSKGVLRGHKRGVWSVQFAPLERALLSASGARRGGRGRASTCLRLPPAACLGLRRQQASRQPPSLVSKNATMPKMPQMPLRFSCAPAAFAT